MEPKIVAGKRVDVLLRAVRRLKLKKSRDGSVKLSATWDREVGLPSCAP